MRKHAQSGFTVVELIIAITVSAILSLAILGFFIDEIGITSKADAKAQLLQEAQTGLDTVNKDIRLSSNADLNNRWPDNYAPTAGNQYSWTSNSTTIILATAAQDTSGNIIFQDASKYIPYKNNLIYFVQNGTLYKRILAAPETGNAALTTCPAAHVSQTCTADKDILDNVTAFSISYRDGGDNSVTPTNARSINLSVTLQQTKSNQPITVTYTSRMVFRND
jgi:prepilin-type N-terminal cleavage/methylation domain-containing protein